jgi:hypothetical protein
MELPNKQSGQALMIVLLALAAVGAVALTISSRSSTDIAVTTDVEESQRAFSAAEAGVEKILYDRSIVSGGQASGAVGSSDAQFSATTTYVPESTNQRQFQYPFPIVAGESATLWLMGHTADNQLTCSGGSTVTPGDPESCFNGAQISMCWGALGGSTRSAMEVSVYYENAAGLSRIKRIAVDPDSSHSNAFSAPTASNETTGVCTVGGKRYAYQTDINFSSMGIANYASTGALQMIRVKSLYNTIPVELAFSSSVNLPIQGIRIDSAGSAGSSTRRINAYSLFPAIPDMFDAALISPPGLTK